MHEGVCVNEYFYLFFLLLLFSSWISNRKGILVQSSRAPLHPRFPAHMLVKSIYAALPPHPCRHFPKRFHLRQSRMSRIFTYSKVYGKSSQMWCSALEPISGRSFFFCFFYFNLFAYLHTWKIHKNTSKTKIQKVKSRKCVLQKPIWVNKPLSKNKIKYSK